MHSHKPYIIASNMYHRLAFQFLAGVSGVDVVEVLAHRSSGALVLRWGSTRPWALASDLPLTSLSAVDALAAKQLLRVSVLNCTEAVHSRAASTVSYAAMHTGLSFWSVPPGRCSISLALCTTLAVDARTLQHGASNDMCLL